VGCWVGCWVGALRDCVVRQMFFTSPSELHIAAAALVRLLQVHVTRGRTSVAEGPLHAGL
jgi:hypothetical protein